jgi:cyclophilin family peptidyl-prolyl cis-trans isomerase
MNCRLFATNLFFSVLLFSSGWAAPVIDPIADVTIPAGKSLIVPVTATSSNGRSLAYTVTSSTNGIAVVMHTNNPFWQLSVAQAASPSAPGAYQTPYRGGVATVTNVGNLTFMLFPEYAPHTVNVFQGLTTSGFYNSNTIFHRIISSFVIQGGDPQTNGSGGLVFNYDDEFNPQAMFSGNGQLALANSGKDTDGSQFFVTLGVQRSLDLRYTIFGQLVRGFDVLTNISNTAVDANDRPLADEIIQTASYVPDTADTVLTLTATNKTGVAGTITVIADDGAGGRTTNVFEATLVTDTNSNNQPFIYPNTATNLVGPANKTLTNFISAVELDGEELYWFLSAASQAESINISTNSGYNQSNNILKTLTYNVTNMDGTIQLFLSATTNYVGPISVRFDVSYNSEWWLYQEYGITPPNYDQQVCTFVFGDTPISGQSNTVSALAAVPFTNVILATFTNGLPGSSSGNFTAFINWGDDSTNSGVVTANAAGKKAVLGSHAYSHPGTYPVYVRVQSAIGASATILSFVTVTNQTTPATNVLTVQVAGHGTVSPDYNNASLAVGGSYSITATPAATNVLASWTDGNGFVLGTGTNLTFTMSPGLSLTANFVVAIPPVLTIVSPSSGRVITNLYSTLATVTGTVSNNAIVTNVWYQVNSGGWQAATGTTNWSASFNPEYDVTNVIQAWAVNNFGYVSTTNTVLVKYLAGDVLTVNTTGLGSITPNLNGALLPLGTNYALTATPASGFEFTNWTGSITTNGATLKFTMATNLTFTANFADTNKPVVSITNLAAGQRVSNVVFTVMGTASDNWRVSNVVCQINGGAWSNATTANLWTNWKAVMNLIPGTNTVAAYAVDTTDNVSTTNKVSFQFVVTNQLSVRAIGLGTVSPNYSNAWLEIGRNYSIISTPASGFAFSNWVTSTNWIGGITTTRTNLPFMMASNLTLQVTFLDVTKPTLSITAPTAGKHMTNALATVVGTASDNWKVGAVWYQLTNGILANGTWSLATTTNNYTNWTTTVTLAAGSNTVKAYAVDLGGNHSTTSSVSVLSSNTFKLQLNFALSQPLTSTGLNFTLQLSSNLNGHIQVSTNLTSWAMLTNFVGTNSTITFSDPSATNSNRRFYRAAIP